ncbi:hypothetical protein H109_05936 [Trichophyton interdigitale MR816]|uniref:Centrosomin N-terminal motif 1 domain-containing protein n=1 Tax=Trichophyton interdigitale (strain MR816) TaxID=1215338 RepID=A0A059J3T4_TRIIM|nr:hypothetical protein H101_02031 [Trichophyton interdigitale H6]KDB22147.1 hypothetical protein H109_05936 [Trichophyton interdigitale MR816]
MAFPYIDTPRTEVDGNATFISQGQRSATRHNLSALDSVENSFVSPTKDHDILRETSDSRNRQRRVSLRTPRASQILKSARLDKRTLPNSALPKGEFTPLMNSVTKNNFLRTGGDRARGVPATPALSKIDESNIYEGASMNSSAYDATPVPQGAPSSGQSTPLPTLPQRDGAGGVICDGQNMTLREQENIINKFDKENFGLKLKIHYLEEQLRKAGPELNQAALKENTELKVSKLTVQRDLHRCKKSLLHAERDLESCQLQLQELRAKLTSKQSDGTAQETIKWMRQEMESKDADIADLQEQLRSAESKRAEEAANLREEINELEYTIREKDRRIEEKEEEIDNLQCKHADENANMADLETELEEARSKIEDLQDSLERARTETEDAETACEQALQEKEQAVEDLRELQDEMANKSISASGLTRQLEERANKLESELTTVRQQYATLQEKLDDKAQFEHRLQEQIKDLRQEHSSTERELIFLQKEHASCQGKIEDKMHSENRLQERIEDLKQELSSAKSDLQHELEQARHEKAIAIRDQKSTLARLQALEDELEHKGETKTLLQTRHDALTNESKALQGDLDRAKRAIAELEEDAAAERQESLNTLEEMRHRHKDEIDRLNLQITTLRREVDKKDSLFNSDLDKWENIKRSLELERDRALQQAEAHKRTVDSLQQMETTKSGREKRLQDIIDSEKQRRLQQEELLTRQIKELNDDISSRREASETQRSELLSLKEQLRVSRREEQTLKEKVQGLEDEIIVLQASLEEEQQHALAQRKTGSLDTGSHLQSIAQEKQALREQLTATKSELNELRVTLSEVEAERDGLQDELAQYDHGGDATRVDHEKLELKKAKLRLERDVIRLNTEKSSLQEAKDALQNEVDNELVRAAAEEERLAAEISRLQDKLFMADDKKDRELLSYRSKTTRLEARLKELEAHLRNPVPSEPVSPPEHADASIFRQCLADTRERERIILQRESDLKSSIRLLKSRITDLEKENHDLQIAKYEGSSPIPSSPASQLQEELRNLRAQNIEAHKALKELKAKNRELEQQRYSAAEESQNFSEVLDLSTFDPESIAAKLAKREARIHELEVDLQRIRGERSTALKNLNAADRRIRLLQDRHPKAIQDMSKQLEKQKSRHDRELEVLRMELLWNQVRLIRAEQFRRDLAWYKEVSQYREQERIRTTCAQIERQMIANMGIVVSEATEQLSPIQKFRAGISVALFIARAKRVTIEWKKNSQIGDLVKRAKKDQHRKQGRVLQR